MRFLEKSKTPLITAATLCLLASAAGGPAAAKRHASAPAPTATPSAQPSASPGAAPTASPDAAPTAQPSASAQISPSPEATASEAPRRRGRAEPSPSPTPTSPAFSTLDGYWEVVLQTSSDNIYSRFDLRQSADTITGTWTRDKQQLPVEGDYDGRTFKLVAKAPAHDLTLTGYVENASDMVGTVDDGSGKEPVAFTASHRASFQTSIFPKRGRKQ